MISIAPLQQLFTWILLLVFFLSAKNMQALDANTIYPDNITTSLLNLLGYNLSAPRVEEKSVSALMKSLKIGEKHVDNQLQHDASDDTHIPCLSSSQLMAIYSTSNISINDSAQKSLDMIEFAALQTALVQQQYSGVCLHVEPNVIKSLTISAYLYASLAVIVISLLSLLGLALIPAMNSTIYPYCMLFMIALGTGTLIGDALLHLLPQVFGLHHHDDEKKEQFHLPEFFNLQCGIFLSMYLFFIIETIGSAIDKTSSNSSAKNDHGHSHVPKLDAFKHGVKETDPLLQRTEITYHTNDEEQLDASFHSNLHHHDHHHLHKHHFEPCDANHQGIHTTKLTAYMIMLGDTVHNFADGLAIGAAFAQDNLIGFSTSLAILFHEIPHELGDFAVLLAAGFSWRKTLALNALSSLSCFVGLFIALPLSVDEELRRWIYAFTVGMFIFLALVEMMPILKEIQVASIWKGVVMSHGGILLGFGLMIVTALFEDSIVL